MGADNYEWRLCGVDYGVPSHAYRGPAWDRRPEMRAWKVAAQVRARDVHVSDQSAGEGHGSYGSVAVEAKDGQA